MIPLYDVSIMRTVECTCNTCGLKFTRKITPSRNVPKFCSNDCKFRSYVKNRTKFNCAVCGEEFEVLVHPSDKYQVKRFCSRSCQGKAWQESMGHCLSEPTEAVCEYCGDQFEYMSRSTYRPRRFCSASCVSKALVEAGGNSFSSLEKLHRTWVRKYGKEEADRRAGELCASRSFSGNSNPRYGVVLDESTRKKIADSCMGTPNAVKGKTFVEFYGPERAAALAEQHSTVLKEGYSSGRLSPVHPRGRTTVYKNVKFRSQLEVKVVKHLESTTGLELGSTLLYEPVETRVPWVDDEGEKHTYIPDLYDTVRKIVYEVKPGWMIAARRRELVLKESAACGCLSQRGMSFMYIDDKCRVVEPLSTHSSF